MKVTEDVSLLDATKGSYAYLISGEEKILVDTELPWQGKSILKELKAMNIEPHEIKHILITHHDVDHVGNLARLEKETNAKIWASQEDIPYIHGEKSRHGHKKIISFFIRTKKPENLMHYPENQNIAEVEVIPTPGHTPGHVCLIYKDVLFAGDLVRNPKGSLETMKSSMNWDNSLVMKSIEKIKKHDFKWICPAHGYPIERKNVDDLLELK